jgi:CheY-like chemotaxis protein
MKKAIQNTSLKKQKTVLLIDDNEIDNFINKKKLEHCGASNIITFTDTIDALNYLKQVAYAPQLILLNSCLPIKNSIEFMDGLKKLEIAKHTINIFIFSAFVNPKDIELALQ